MARSPPPPDLLSGHVGGGSWRSLWGRRVRSSFHAFYSRNSYDKLYRVLGPPPLAVRSSPPPSPEGGKIRALHSYVYITIQKRLKCLPQLWTLNFSFFWTRCQQSQQLRGHGNDYADIVCKFEGLSLTLKVQSAEKKYFGNIFNILKLGVHLQ